MQKSSRTRFSLSTFPDAQHFQYFVIFLILAGASFFAPTLLPDIGKSSLDASLLQRTKQFEVKNDIQAGQFRSTAHEGDTKTSLDATFYGVSILTTARAKSHGVSLNNADRTKKWVSSLDPSNLQEIYEIAVILKRLQALDSKKSNDLYAKILALAENNSGFKLDVEHSTSARASYYAFQAIEELGKFNEFKNTESYKSTIEFVTSLRDENTGGYADSLGQNATLDATYYAFKVLPSPKEGSEAFVLKTQRQDGGFANDPITDAYEFYSESDVAQTARGIYVLEKCGVYSTYTFVDGSTHRAFTANSFLRYHIREKPDLEGISQFFDLVDAFPYIGYGTPRALELVFVGLGALFALLAVINFYQPQLPSDSLNGLYSAVVTSAILFGVGAAGVLFFAQAAVVTYIIAGFYLLATYYQAQTIDTPEGVMVLIGSINSMIFLGVVVSLSYISPYIYAQASVFYILIGLSVVSTLATSYGGAYFTPKQKINFFIRAGLLGWVTNVIVFFVFLYARGDMDFVFYLSLIRGTFPLIFVYFPLLSLVSSYFFSAVGYLLCAK